MFYSRNVAVANKLGESKIMILNGKGELIEKSLEWSGKHYKFFIFPYSEFRNSQKGARWVGESARLIESAILAPIGMHFTWNFVQGPVFGFAVSGHPTKSMFIMEPSGNDLSTGGAFGLEGSVILTGILLAAIAMYWWLTFGRARNVNPSSEKEAVPAR